MKYFILVIFSFFISFNIVANTSEFEVKKYAQIVANDSITKVFNKKLDKEKRFSQFRQAIYDNLDFDYISRFIIGAYGRDLSSEKFKKFSEMFAELNVYTYFKKFALYSDAEIKVVKVEPGKRQGQYFVLSKVTGNLADREYSVSWRIMKINQKYKVIDIIIEGVSMSMSYKNEYMTFLKNGSIDSLILEMSQKVNILKDQNNK